MVALVGCTKTELVPTPEKEITFAVGSYMPATKTTSLNGSEDAITTFSSKGFLHAEGVATTQDFFGADGETITYNSSVPEWAPSHAYYWPKGSSSHINFVSWYDKNAPQNFGTSVTENSISWAIDGTNRTLQADDNIMIADEAWGYNANATEYVAYSGVASGVPTLFHHLLARVRVVVKASKLSDTGVSWEVTAGEFTMSNLYTTGTISLSNTEPDTTPDTSAWETTGWSLTGNRTHTLNGVTEAVNVTTAGVELFSHSVIPQTTANLARIAFTYTVKTIYGPNDYIIETVNTGNISLGSFSNVINAWEMNKKITYIVTINPECNEILIDPQASDWSEPTVPAISIE